jgi:hypothetical protein
VGRSDSGATAVTGVVTMVAVMEKTFQPKIDGFEIRSFKIEGSSFSNNREAKLGIRFAVFERWSSVTVNNE